MLFLSDISMSSAVCRRFETNADSFFRMCSFGVGRILTHCVPMQPNEWIDFENVSKTTEDMYTSE